MSSAELHAGRGGAWQELKRRTFNAWSADPDAYRRRVETVVDLAVATKVDVLLLPAAVLVIDAAMMMADYSTSLERTPFVVAGTLRRVAGKLSSRAVVMRNGHVVDDFDCNSVRRHAFGDVQVLVAISSTILGAAAREPMSGRHGDRVTTLALSTGHHGYRGRFARGLDGTARRISGVTGGTTLVSVASWRFLRSRGADPWCRPKAAWWSWTRLLATQHAGVADTLDVIDLAI